MPILRTTLSPEDEAQRAVDQDRHVDNYRERVRRDNREEARRRIAALYGRDDERDLFDQLNAASWAVYLVDKLASGTPLTPEERTDLDTYNKTTSDKDAIRDAENVASLQLDAAGTDKGMEYEARIAEIDAVAVVWPSTHDRVGALRRRRYFPRRRRQVNGRPRTPPP